MKPRAGELPRPCTHCGQVITAEAWASMEWVGLQPVPADPDDPKQPDAYVLELRNHACGTTMGVIVEPG